MVDHDSLWIEKIHGLLKEFGTIGTLVNGYIAMDNHHPGLRMKYMH